MPAVLTKDILEQTTKPIVIGAFASWCPHCAKMKPLFEQLEKELSDSLFAQFDIDKDQAFTTQFGILSIPTFIVLKNNKEVARTMGAMPYEQLKEFVEKSL